MLIVSRKISESIFIGDDIEVMVTRVKGGNVSLGVSAPSYILVRRNRTSPDDPAGEDEAGSSDPAGKSSDAVAVAERGVQS